ncbi:MAG: alkaline phosphatase family protein [Flavobacteriales bacterium]|nr:alkaline phosphatase family protein [Flavobacteriales bacterium]
MDPEALRSQSRLASRLLVIGWDAADWLILDALFAQGRMPHLRKLLARGIRADLKTLEPKLSPILWTSVATGKTCDKHGILNFVEPKPDGDGLRVVRSTSRRTMALWNILSRTGLTTNVVGWYASHPAEPVQGRIVTNLLQEAEPGSAGAPWPILSGSVHPVELAETIAAQRQRTHAFPKEQLRMLLPSAESSSKDLVGHLKKLMAHAMSVEAAAHLAMEAGPWDATMVFFDAIDTVGHHFMQYRPPRMSHVTEREVRQYGAVMDRVYEWHDASLGRLLERAGPEATVILLSDHGFHSGAKRPNLKGLPPEQRMELEASWHRPFGILAAAGPGVVPGAVCGPCSLLDIAPTALALLGVAVGEDMDGRVLQEILDPGLQVAHLPSWDAVEGDAGMHPADLRQDPLETHAAIMQLIDLGYLAALPKDKKAQVDLVSRESRFNLATSLIAQLKHAEAVPILQALALEQPGTARYGAHLVQSLMATGEHEKALATVQDLCRRDPSNTEARLMLAQILVEAGDLEEGGKAATQAERLAGDRVTYALALAGLALRMGRFADAVRHAQRALKADAKDIGAHLALAQAQLASGHFEEAAEHALDALEITQAIPEAHHLLGMALAWYGDFANALESFEMALRFDPEAVESHAFAALVATLASDERSAARHRTAAGAPAAGSRRTARDRPYGLEDFAAKHGLGSS